MRGQWVRAHEFYTKCGIAGIWNDMNEPAFFNLKRPLPDPLNEMPPYDEQPFLQQTDSGSVGHLEVRNRYGMLMCRATHEGLRDLLPTRRPFVLSRSAYAGSQRYAAVWLGDNNSWWEHLALSVPMLLNAGLSGLAFAGVDIGGFSGDCSAELLVRWYETGIFYPFFRNHCRLGERRQEPWAFGPVAEAHIRHLIETRYRLLPYIYSLFWQCARSGAPLMRPLAWHYADDSVARDIDNQFMFGDDIMVAPVTQRGKTTRPVYFPKGRWHSWEKPELTFEGPSVHVVEMPLGAVPAFVREGAILPLLDIVQSTHDYATAPITLSVYGTRATGVLFDDEGRSMDYLTGAYNEWKFEFAGGQFASQLLHSGYTAPPRQYFVQVGKERRKPIVLEPVR
jgi:alpha-glucosidase